MTDPFVVLGVSRSASREEIRKAYHKLCLAYHPDKAGVESEKRMQQINAAYEAAMKIHEKNPPEASAPFKNPTPGGKRSSPRKYEREHHCDAKITRLEEKVRAKEAHYERVSEETKRLKNEQKRLWTAYMEARRAANEQEQKMWDIDEELSKLHFEVLSISLRCESHC